MILKEEYESGYQAPVIDVKGRKRGIKQWVVCPICEKGRWVRIDSTKIKSFSGMCGKCHNKFTSGSMENHPRWKGGKRKSRGYVMVKLSPNDSYYSMATNGGGHYVREHRLIMAKHIGRCLLSWEVVHHKNGIRDDNRIENLELLPKSIDNLSIDRLIAENKSLKKQLEKYQEGGDKNDKAKI